MVGLHDIAPTPGVQNAGSVVPDPAPTLAEAPEGLSARRVERWLDLPPGAWQRRHLYALRVTGPAFEDLGFRPGDIAIVEPGIQDRPGRLVVTRGPRGMALRRTPSDGSSPLPGRHPRAERIPSVLELPFCNRGLDPGERVVGAVIGHLRSTGTGALRSVSGQRRPRPAVSRRRPASLRGAAMAFAPGLQPAEDPLLHLQELRERWRLWLRENRERLCGQAGGAGRLDRWERLDASLGVLCECLEKTHSANLRAALAEETRAVLSAIRAEMRG